MATRYPPVSVCVWADSWIGIKKEALWATIGMSLIVLVGTLAVVKSGASSLLSLSSMGKRWES